MPKEKVSANYTRYTKKTDNALTCAILSTQNYYKIKV